MKRTKRKKKVSTHYDKDVSKWYVTDNTGSNLCSYCRQFHRFGGGYGTRERARQAVRDYLKVDLIGGLH